MSGKRDQALANSGWMTWQTGLPKRLPSLTLCGRRLNPAAITTRVSRSMAGWAGSLTFMCAGKHRVERIPKEWAENVAARVRAGREFQDAVREVLAANAELLILARQQQRHRRR